MTKIGIFEDDGRALKERYCSLSGKHELYVHLDDSSMEFMDYRVWLSDDGGEQMVAKKRVEMKEELSRMGLAVKEAYFGRDEMPHSLDLYFIDGLGGDCFEVADEFGKDRCYILTGDSYIKEAARKRGYNLVESLEEIIGRHSNGI